MGSSWIAFQYISRAWSFCALPTRLHCDLAAKKMFVGCNVARVALGEAGGFRLTDLDRQLLDNAAHDFVLHSEQVPHLAVETLRPDLPPGIGLDETDVQVAIGCRPTCTVPVNR